MSEFTKHSIPLGRIAGIPIRLHVTFPVVFAAALLVGGFNSWAALGWAAVMYGPFLLVTVLLHELGHSLAARRAGGEAEGILLWPLGGLAYLAHSAGPKADLLIALAGPLTHIPQFLLWFGILFPVYHAYNHSWDISLKIPDADEQFGLALVAGACQFNIALAAFNLLLPAYPLDGGRIFADTLLLCGMRAELAAKITVALAVVLGLGVVGLGIWWVSVLTICVGVWMLWSTWYLFEAIRAGAVAQHPLFAYSASSSGGASAGSAQGGSSATQLPAVGTGGGYHRYNDGEV